jgi:prepilin-type N-terminal cleavage/methylation domain-containing protein
MLKHLHNQRGDTIVEVLIAVAIISLVLVTAFVITNKNTLAIQNNQERIQAQHLAEAQIEALRSQGGVTASGNCFNGASETAACGSFTQSGSGATYSAKVEGPSGLNPPAPTGKYTITVRWTSLGGGSNNDSSVTMAYRLN